MTETNCCSFCKEPLPEGAVICPNCGNHLTALEVDSAPFEMQETISSPHRGLMVASTVFLIIGSLLPWGKVVSSMGTLVIRGIDGDGVLTAVVGGLLLVVAFIGVRNSQLQRFLFIMGGAFSTLILLPKISYLQKLLVGAPAGTESQIGFWLIIAIIAAMGTIVSGLLTHRVKVIV